MRFIINADVDVEIDIDDFMVSLCLVAYTFIVVASDSWLDLFMEVVEHWM
jgi:hypothetical protein